MSADPRPRAYPILSRACIAVGCGFLLLSAFGNWRFGWGLAAELIDKIWLALIYSGSDVAAGILCATGAVMLHHVGWRWKLGGIVAMVPALILVSLSILSTFGMMSGRIAVSTGQQAALREDQKRLSWIRQQALNRENSKTDRRLFRLEERQAYKEAREAASVVTDNQVVAIVNGVAMLGIKIKEETAQVGITFLTSTVPMMVKFCGIWLGFFLFGIRLDAQKSQEGSRGSGGSSGGSGGGETPKPKLVHPEPKPEPAKVKAAEPSRNKASRVGSRVQVTSAPQLSAFDRAYEAAIAHPHLSTRALAAVAGVSQMTGSRVKQRLRGKVDTIVRKHGNGGGYRPAYN